MWIRLEMGGEVNAAEYAILGSEEFGIAEDGVAHVTGIPETGATDRAWPSVDIQSALANGVACHVVVLTSAQGVIGVHWVDVAVGAVGAMGVFLKKLVTAVHGFPGEVVTIAIGDERTIGGVGPHFLVSEEGATMAAGA